MLAQLFATVFWMSITATIVAVVVVLASLLLGWWHVPRKFICLLYALVLLRMVCPLGLPGDWGLFHLPFIQTVQEMAADFSGYSGEYEVAVEGSAEYDAAVAAGLTPERIIKDAPQSALYVPYRLGGDGTILPAPKAMETWVPKVAAVWLAGMAVFYGLTAVSYFRLRRRLRFAVREEDGVYVSDRIPSPCVVGYFRPRIYLVPALSAEERAHILAHERAHLRAGDHWAKLIAWLALGVHWFNFYLWSVYRCYCSDLEKACDERVLRAADVEARKAYSRTLLHLACDRRFVWFNPAAFAEGGTKERIAHVLHLRRPKPVLLALAAAAAVLVVLLVLPGGGPARTNAGEPVVDHTGMLSAQQIRALAAPEWAGFAGLPAEADWISTKDFYAAEILNVETDGDLYTIELLEGNVLFQWILHGTGSDQGAAGCYFGQPWACRYTLRWDGETFALVDPEWIGESVNSGYGGELDTSGLSEEALACMNRTGAGAKSIWRSLCRQAADWYGCRAYQPYVLGAGRYGSVMVDADGAWYFDTLRFGGLGARLGGFGIKTVSGDLAPLRELGRSPAGTDTSAWSDEQLVWALSAAEGDFAGEAAAALYERFTEDPVGILQEITALGGAGRDAVCWALAEQWCAAHEAGEGILTAAQTRACTPAMTATLDRLETACRAVRAGESALPAEEGGSGGWVIQAPVSVEGAGGS